MAVHGGLLSVTVCARQYGCRCAAYRTVRRHASFSSYRPIHVRDSLGSSANQLHVGIRRDSWHGGNSIIPIRWQSGEGKGGGGGSGGDGRRGFFQSFLENVRKGIARNREVQDSLKGFHEERTKLQKSYFLQAAQDKLTSAKEQVSAFGERGIELAMHGWSRMRERSTAWFRQASETELGKKGQDLGSRVARTAQETAEKVSEHAEELGKTDVAKTISKGATTVKEELLDDIIKESGPYQPPDKIRTRSEMASEGTSAQDREDIIQPNEETRDVAVTKQSRFDSWRQQWESLRENNPISNAFYNAKMRYDESSNLFVRASRVVTDRVGDVFSGTMTQSDMAETLAEIRKIDRSFSKEEFVKQCQFEIIPTILEAYLIGDEEVLKDWCHEAAFNMLLAVIKQRGEPGVHLDCRILEVRDVDILLAKLLDPGPVLVLAFQAQQVTVKSREVEGERVVEDEVLENIHYIWALCRDQSIYDPKAAWRVMEFGIQQAGKLLV